MSDSSIVLSIVEAFGLPELQLSSSISKSAVIQWMNAEDIEAQGAIYSFISKPMYAKRIDPALTVDEYRRFMLRYFEACVRLDPDGEWAHSRYEAMWDLTSWFKKIWCDKDIPRTVLEEIKLWLAELYRSGDQETKRCIVDGGLEHIFELPKARKFFADWKSDKDLSVAYEEASEWIVKQRAKLSRFLG